MTTARTETYAADRGTAYFLGLGTTQLLQCPVRHGIDGSLVAPSSGTITVEMPDGSALVTAAIISVVSSVASYDLATLSTHTEGEGWTIIWSLVFSDGNTYQFRYEAFACENPPYCPLTVADLWGREPESRHRIPQQWRATADGGDNSGLQPFVDAAHYALLDKLIADGNRPWRIRNVHGAKEWCLSLALMRYCNSQATTADSIWRAKAVDYSHAHREAAGSLRFQYDSDPATTRRAAAPVTRLCPADRPWY